MKEMFPIRFYFDEFWFLSLNRKLAVVYAMIIIIATIVVFIRAIRKSIWGPSMLSIFGFILGVVLGIETIINGIQVIGFIGLILFAPFSAIVMLAAGVTFLSQEFERAKNLSFIMIGAWIVGSLLMVLGDVNPLNNLKPIW
jgi:hypothetical protein